MGESGPAAEADRENVLQWQGRLCGSIERENRVKGKTRASARKEVEKFDNIKSVML